MATEQLLTRPAEKSTSHTAIVWLTIVVLVTAFYFIEHRNPPVLTQEEYSISENEFVERVAEGDLGRRVAIPALGAFGAILLLLRDGIPLKLTSRLGILLVSFFIWCLLSIFWSDDPALTFRHCTVLLFCGLGILGISRQVTLRDLCLIALCGLSAFVFYSIGLEISQGTFRPFSPDYRFAGTQHPNAQAPNCAIMALSAAFLARHAKRGRLLLWTLCLIGLATLLLTKSRTVCGALLVSVLIYKALGQPLGKKTLATVIMLWAVSTVALASTVVDWNFESQAVNVALIGRQDEAESLSGRIPLWTELLPYISEHPIVGHGYMTFWTPQRVSTFTHNLQWTVPDGHCAYLDMLLELGLVGISICALTIIVSFAELRRRIFAGGDFGYAFFFIILACRVLNGFLESAFAVPTTFVAFIVACGLSHLALGEMPNHILETDEVPA